MYLSVPLSSLYLNSKLIGSLLDKLIGSDGFSIFFFLFTKSNGDSIISNSLLFIFCEIDSFWTVSSGIDSLIIDSFWLFFGGVLSGYIILCNGELYIDFSFGDDISSSKIIFAFFGICSDINSDLDLSSEFIWLFSSSKTVSSIFSSDSETSSSFLIKNIGS